MPPVMRPKVRDASPITVMLSAWRRLFLRSMVCKFCGGEGGEFWEHTLAVENLEEFKEKSYPTTDSIAEKESSWWGVEAGGC